MGWLLCMSLYWNILRHHKTDRKFFLFFVFFVEIGHMFLESMRGKQICWPKRKPRFQLSQRNHFSSRISIGSRKRLFLKRTRKLQVSNRTSSWFYFQSNQLVIMSEFSSFCQLVADYLFWGFYGRTQLISECLSLCFLTNLCRRTQFL